MNKEQLLDDAKVQFSNMHFEKSIELCTRILSESPESIEGVACRVIRASSYELVDSPNRKLSLSCAVDDYSSLADEPGWIGAMGHAGLARTLYFQDAESNAERIKLHADIAIERSGHVPSMIVAGTVVSEVFLDGGLSRKYFLRAARARDYWGLKYLCMSIGKGWGWLAIRGIVPLFYMIAPFFKKREQPFDD